MALWILCSDDAKNLLGFRAWDDLQSTDLANDVHPKFLELLSSNQTQLSSLSKLAVVTGPGAFTGLRVTASYIQGLARTLDLPTISVPTFDLIGEKFQIPLQHQKAKTQSTELLQKQDYPVLLIKSQNEFEVVNGDPKIKSLGFSDFPLWPSPEMFLEGIKKNLERCSTETLKISYGLDAKISGERKDFKT